MKKIILGLLIQLVITFTVNAQQINGVIKEEQGYPVQEVTITLLRAEDSAVVKLSVTKDSGVYTFNAIAAGTYMISASHTGYKTTWSTPFILNHENITLSPLVIVKEVAQLKGVTVVARKKLVEVKGGKTVLNVEGTINSVGSDALELLRKAPGVSLDGDNRISVSGKTGVQIFIDGRPTPLTSQQLTDYLKSLSASQIESIEIMPNPPASYEAAGNAGIINIRLRKNRSLGTNGTITGGWNYGTYAKYTAGIALNHRTKKLNVFANYNYNQGVNKSTFSLYRLVKDTAFHQRNDNRFESDNHHLKAGVDYTLNTRNTLGFMVDGALSEPGLTLASRTPIVYHPTNTVDRILVANNKSTMKNNNILLNLNYAYQDTAGRRLTVHGNYGYYDINNDQLQPNYFFDATGRAELSRAIYRIISPSQIDIYSLKADYEQNYKKGKLALGVKTSYVNTDNDFRQYNLYQGGDELDKDRSNTFQYREQIQAGYVNYSKAFPGIAVQGGVRVEQTSLKGTAEGLKKSGSVYEPYVNVFKRDYIDFFPSASVTFNKSPMSQVTVSYSRRIDRPVYQDLNPFELKINEYTFHKGNTTLRPQYTNNISVSHSYKNKLNTSLAYSHVSDMFAQIIDTVDGVKGFLTNKNLASQRVTSLTISYPFQYKAYSLFANVNSYYAQYKANYGTGRVIDRDILAVKFFAQNTLRFGKTWTAELSGFYTTPEIWQGSIKSEAMWSVDGGIQKEILKGKASLKMAVSDLFQTLKWNGDNYFAGQYLKSAQTWESRQLKLHFTYRFGNAQVKAARQQNTGVEEESKRVQTSANSGH